MVVQNVFVQIIIISKKLTKICAYITVNEIQELILVYKKFSSCSVPHTNDSTFGCKKQN